jgi:hypothetical protein
MTIDEARKIADDTQGWGWGYVPGDSTAVLDGHFTADELEAIAMVLRADATVRDGDANR